MVSYHYDFMDLYDKDYKDYTRWDEVRLVYRNHLNLMDFRFRGSQKIFEIIYYFIMAEIGILPLAENRHGDNGWGLRKP